MKLSKDTRHLVTEGTILKDGLHSYIVTGMWQSRRGGITIAVRDTEDKRPIYGSALSSWYGVEIVEESL